MFFKDKSFLLIFSFIILSIFLIFVIVNTTKIIYQKKQVDNQISQLESEIRNYEQKNQNLINLIEQFKDPNFLEKEIRKNLNFQKEGEQVIMIIKDEKDKKSDLINKQNSKEVPNYKKWLKFIFSIDY